MRKILIFLLASLLSSNSFCQKIDIRVVLDSVFCQHPIYDTANRGVFYYYEWKDSIITDSLYNYQSCIKLIVCKTDKELLKYARRAAHRKIPVIVFYPSDKKTNDSDDTIIKYTFDEDWLEYKEFKKKYRSMTYNGDFYVLFKKDDTGHWKIYKIIRTGAY